MAIRSNKTKIVLIYKQQKQCLNKKRMKNVNHLQKLLFMTAVLLVLSTAANAAIIANWTFDETDGSLYSDRSGNSHSLICADACPGYNISGFKNGAAQFEGANLTNTSLYNLLNTSFTVSVWIYPFIGHDGTIFQSYQTPAGTYWALLAVASAGPVCAGELYDGTHNPSSGNIGITTGTWTHLVFYRAANSNISIYVNGVYGTSSADTTYGFEPDSDRFIIGSRSASNAFKGLIDEMVIYDTILTDAEILNLNNSYTTTTTTTTEATTTSEATTTTEITTTTTEETTTTTTIPTCNMYYYYNCSEIPEEYCEEYYSDLDDGYANCEFDGTCGLGDVECTYTPPEVCSGNYTFNCYFTSPEDCNDSYTYDRGTYYQCNYDVDICEEDEVCEGTNPNCQSNLVSNCYEIYTEEECATSYISTGGPDTEYNCIWYEGACYYGEICSIVVPGCNSDYILACPMTNDSRQCDNSYTYGEGGYTNCYWDEEYNMCWWDSSCQKYVYDECPSTSVEDCSILSNSTDCNKSYVVGYGNYSWNCVWYEDYCYYGEECHVGGEVTTTSTSSSSYASSTSSSRESSIISSSTKQESSSSSSSERSSSSSTSRVSYATSSSKLSSSSSSSSRYASTTSSSARSSSSSSSSTSSSYLSSPSGQSTSSSSSRYSMASSTSSSSSSSSYLSSPSGQSTSSSSSSRASSSSSSSSTSIPEESMFQEMSGLMVGVSIVMGGVLIVVIAIIPIILLVVIFKGFVSLIKKVFEKIDIKM